MTDDNDGDRALFARFLREEENSVARMSAAITHYVAPLRSFLQRFNDPALREVSQSQRSQLTSSMQTVLQHVGTEAIFDVLRHFDALELLQHRASSFVEELRTVPRSLPSAFADHADLVELYVKYCSRNERVEAVLADLTSNSEGFRDLLTRCQHSGPSNMQPLKELLARPANRVAEYLAMMRELDKHGTVHCEAALGILEAAGERISKRRDREERRIQVAALARSIGGTCLEELDLSGSQRLIRQADVVRLRPSNVRATASYRLLLFVSRLVLCKAPASTRQYRVAKSFQLADIRVRDHPNTPEHSNIIEIVSNAAAGPAGAASSALPSTAVVEQQPLLAAAAPAATASPGETTRQSRQPSFGSKRKAEKADAKAKPASAGLRLLFASHEEKTVWLVDIREGIKGRIPREAVRRARETMDFGSSQLASSSEGWANNSLDATGAPGGRLSMLQPSDVSPAGIVPPPEIPAPAIAPKPADDDSLVLLSYTMLPSKAQPPALGAPPQPQPQPPPPPPSSSSALAAAQPPVDESVGSPMASDSMAHREPRHRSRSDTKDKPEGPQPAEPASQLPPQLFASCNPNIPAAAESGLPPQLFRSYNPHAVLRDSPQREFLLPPARIAEAMAAAGRVGSGPQLLRLHASPPLTAAPPPLPTLPAPMAPAAMPPLPVARNILAHIEGDPDLAEVRVFAADTVGDVVKRLETEILDEGTEVDKLYKCLPSSTPGMSAETRVLLRRRQYGYNFEEMLELAQATLYVVPKPVAPPKTL